MIRTGIWEGTGLEFRGLTIGQRFNFVRDDVPFNDSLPRGPWVKVGLRSYKHEGATADSPPIEIGSVRCAVELSDSTWPLAF